MKQRTTTKSTKALNKIYADLEDILGKMSLHLSQSFCGNKAAAQRMRVASIEFCKIAKIYRALSIKEEKEQLRK